LARYDQLLTRYVPNLLSIDPNSLVISTTPLADCPIVIYNLEGS